jgi:uncharacterized RDD family membrane protein YckC
MRNITLWRRIASMLYDSVLIVALLIVMSLPLISFNIQENIILKTTVQVYSYLIIQYFFVWFWVNSSGTLGMKSWKIKIVDNNGNKITYRKAILRFNIAIISILIFGIGFILSIFRKDRKCLHDIISKTILIKI